MIRRWLLPWRRQKAQSVAPPTPTPETTELAALWGIDHQLVADTAQPTLVALFELAQHVEAETGNIVMLTACWPKAQSIAQPAMLFELMAAFGFNRNLGASVQLEYLLMASFDLTMPGAAQSGEYDLKGDL